MEFRRIQKDWRQYAKTDVLSGFVVFLIALPLCVGISVASGAPPTAGLLAGIIGGVIASMFGGSYVTINGPAAGLIVIIIDSIDGLGQGDGMLGFKRTLAAMIFVGVFQFFTGVFRKGFLGKIFPSSVVHGMMASIGLIIISKQLFVLIGANPISKAPWELYLEFPSRIVDLNPEIFLIGLVALAILLFFQFVKLPYLSKIPAPLLAVIAGIMLVEYFNINVSSKYNLFGKEYTADSHYLVQIPSSMKEAIIFPDFSMVGTLVFWFHTLMIFFIASLESLLSASAVDKIDPLRRSTDMDQELIGKGLANALLGFIGGIPIIAEIVRSKANIENGAKSVWSNFFHGSFLLLFLLLFPELLKLIPMSSLAAILILIGFRLAAPKEFIHRYKTGKEQLIVFLTTIFFTIFIDLLVGILAGVTVKMIIQMISGVKWRDYWKLKITGDEKKGIWKISSPILFLNSFKMYDNVQKSIDAGNKFIVLDVADANYIDHTSMEIIDSIKEDAMKAGAKINFKWGNLKAISEAETAVKRNVT
ncbi:MAG: SulP family inorganic anion transporter [Leptospira sp.]|nr:SulP family inorganic anion transporter [Leptospira sp.]NCS94111.1 SulP family inorganic anion transporter [Leptospira sp.]